MGFKPVKKLLDLEFVDYPGLEIRARSASIAEIKEAQELNIDVGKKDIADEERLEAFTFFEKKIVTWNLEHPELDESSEEDPERCKFCGLKEDEPMPPTVKSMMCLDFSLMLAIVFGYIQTVARVAVPKGMSLPNGVSNGLGNVPMDGVESETMQKLATLQSPGTLPTPNLS